MCTPPFEPCLANQTAAMPPVSPAPAAPPPPVGVQFIILAQGDVADYTEAVKDAIRAKIAAELSIAKQAVNILRPRRHLR